MGTKEKVFKGQVVKCLRKGEFENLTVGKLYVVVHGYGDNDLIFPGKHHSSFNTVDDNGKITFSPFPKGLLSEWEIVS